MDAISNLEHRLSRLEKSARRWRIASIAMAIALAGVALLAAGPAKAPEDEIRTHKLVLLDDKGRTLAEMTSGGEPFGGLKFYNPETKAIVSAIGIVDGTGYLSSRKFWTHDMCLLDEKDRTVAEMRYEKDKIGGLWFDNPDTTAHVCGVGLGADGSGLLYINTKDGREAVTHTGAVNANGVPIEKILQKLDAVR